MRPLILLASALVAAPALAQTPGSCTTGTAMGFLDVSNVQASVFNTGGLFYGGSTTSGDGYLVPKASGNSPIFAAGIWLSGTVNDEIRVAAARYGNYNFWPGPLNADGTLPNPTDCSSYDRIYVVSGLDLDQYSAGQTPARDLAEWPVGLGAPTVDASGAPVVATSREQVIDLAAGERPDLLGSQMAFWVMNDVGNEHPASGSTAPLGVEVQVTGFVISGAENLQGADEASFYRLTVINRSPFTIDNFRFSFFSDPDLGGAGDDYVGTDTTRNMAFVYNSDAEDSAYGIPPAAGYDVLNHELATTSTFLGGGPAGTQDPGTAEHYYNYMQGLWGNGTPITAFGFGYQTDGPVIPFIFPGDPVTGSFWSEVNTDGSGSLNSFGDRRLVATSAHGRLTPGDSAHIDLGVLFAQGTDWLDSITELRGVSDRVQVAYDAGTLFTRGASPRLLAAPILASPDDGDNVAEADTVRFTWRSVAGAEAYAIRWSRQPDGPFALSDLVQSDTTALRSVSQITTDSGTQPVYWQVSAVASGAIGAWSDVRSVTVYRGGALELADGTPAFVEVVGPGGSDPCAVGVVSPDGCDEVFGNLVYASLNSTGEYYMTSPSGITRGSEGSLPQFAPNDFEIRFTEAGGLGYFAFFDNTVIRVPFEIWDIGVVAPGEANDPTDDERLIPVLLADNGGNCAFNADEIPEGQATESGYVESDRIYAYYPATTYADFELAYSDLVASAPEQCYADTDVSAGAYIDDDRGWVLRRQVFGSSSDAPALPATGTVIRFYTADPQPVAAETPPRAGDLHLGAPYPNPTASSLTVPYTLATPGNTELAIYDVLGRRVVELVKARQPEGAHTAQLDASALAPGVYVVRLRAGDETRTSRITVVR